MKSLFVILAATITLSGCGQAVAGTAIPTGPSKQEQFIITLEADTGEEVTDPEAAEEEARNVCRQMSYVRTSEQLVTYLGAYHLANRRGATPESTGKMVATMMMYACPATALRMAEIFE